MKSIPFVFLIFLFSCTSDTDQKEEDLKKEIMAIHDELMPKMDNIQNLKRKLEENRGYLTADSISVDAPRITSADLDSLVQALENADESMMSWMRNYNKFDEPTFTHEEQMEYLHKEKEKIETVRLKIISSILEAENLVEREITALTPSN